MDETKASQSSVLEAELGGIQFGLATHKEICTASISDCSISHSSQLTNPFLGLPLEFGKCESCGTSEPGKCEGHFGYIELPIPIYHPSHISELKSLLNLICLKCLKLKKIKTAVKKNSSGVAERLFSCCEEGSLISIKEAKTSDGACFLELKLPSRSRIRDDFWNFLERYGFRYGDGFKRTLLPCEVMQMLKKIPAETNKKLAGKGYFPQDGYVIQYLPVPPNCLSVPDVSDGVSVMSSDLSLSMLKKVLKQVEIIKSSRSGAPNFESHEIEANELQLAVDRYLQVRGTTRAARDVEPRYGVTKESNGSSTKAWLEKMRTLFIRKGSGFSSRSVITGDSYKEVTEIGIPYEVAQRITFEERVNVHNLQYLQNLVDNKLCLTYRDGSSTYSLREGSKGHTYLRPGQIVHRRIMDGDIVFVNRPPTTHKHSLQALSVYVHDDHTVKINPLICGPLSADFDGDCIHLFYPQSLAAKAEVLELFSVEKQLVSSHSGNLNLQLTKDSLLSLKMMFKSYFLDKSSSQQLAMYVSPSLPPPALMKVMRFGPYWTAWQILQAALPASFDCSGEKFLVKNSDILMVDSDRDAVASMVNDILMSLLFEKGSGEVLKFFNLLQPFLTENLFSEGFSVSLEDFSLSREVKEQIRKDFKIVSPLLCNLRTIYNELVSLQIDQHILHCKQPVSRFILSSSFLGDLIESRSDSAVSKVVQQVGFLGLEISDRGKFYSKTLVDDLASHFLSKYPSDVVDYPSAQYGLIRGCFFDGLDPYEEIVHSISTREVIVRSSRGLSEPGTLFKNLMAILRDVAICYDGTVRNVCSNTIIQFEYGLNAGPQSQSLFPAGEPVGVLAATAMSNPAYKAVLDSTPSSNNSWELMKEILLCKVSFKNDLADRRVILYLNDCACGRNYCQEKAAYMLRNHLSKVSLKDIAKTFMIEYRGGQTVLEGAGLDTGLVGHVHLQKEKLQDLNIGTEVVLQKCQEKISSFRKKKKTSSIFKKTNLSFSECCSFQHSHADELSGMPCLRFSWQDNDDNRLEKTSNILADIIFPVLLETIIKGDHRVSCANIILVSPETTTWIRNPSTTRKGELALDICLEKSAVKQSGDAWRVVLDSCLPVLDLIDTTRSTPYAIKQVQELLGVSCAFDQAVQRLSASVNMVAKGVLKEHLILLANSMTCAGNLVGFNTGGYKALSRSLDIQVPFTEATLFTPRRVFERAAEKCHTDSLSSIVASCSWGKRVAVGTGSCFDILWDTKDATLNQETSTDVYNFLSMLRSGTKGEELATDCLGAEVDGLLPEDEIEDWNLSPEHNPGMDKPTFEDSAMFEDCLDKEKAWSSGGNWNTNVGADKEKPLSSGGGWDAITNGRTNTQSSGGGWDANTNARTDTQSSGGKWNADDNVGAAGEKPWSAWGKNSVQTEDVPSKEVQKGSDMSSGWDTAAAHQENAYQSKGNSAAEPNSWSAWGSKTTETHDAPAMKDQESARVGDYSASAGCGRNSEENFAHQDASSWNPEVPSKTVKSTSWGKPKSPELSHDWGSPKGSFKAASSQARASSTTPEDAPNSSNWDSEFPEEPVNKSSWGKPKSAEVVHAWGSPKESFKAASPLARASSTTLNDASNSSTWDSECPSNEEPVNQSSWGKPKSPEVVRGWGSSKETVKAASSPGWNSSTVPEDASKSSGSEGPSQSPVNNSPRGKPKSPEVSNGWGTPKEPWKAASSQGWGAPKPGVGNAMDRNQKRGGRGWGSNPGDWKGKNRPAGMGNDDFSASAMQTVTRQRLDMFTSQEQDILTVLEPLMLSIRKIMHGSGYNDGDPLSASDQSYIIDNVFNYHPDKAAKMGDGIDHLMISKHSNFQDTRCLYVVSTGGDRQDFSYRKCLENFIKEKYPDLAAYFIEKYFAKRRPGANQQERQNAAVGAEEQQNTPVETEEQQNAPVETEEQQNAQ